MLFKQGLLSWLMIGLLCVTLNVQAQAPIQAPVQTRFSFNASGDEVTDSKTKLVWKRCTEGMSWNGKVCTNSARTFTQEEALKLFKTPAAGAEAWRLPTVDELFNLADRDKKNPAIDTVVFPQTQVGLYWALPYTGRGTQPWGVDFASGYIGDGYRSYNSYVRLVR